MPVPPGSIHLHCHTVHQLLHLPLWVSTTGQIRNYQSSVAGVGLSLGEKHFPTNSLTWREMLTGLTTCLFYHKLDNLLLQPVSTQFLQGEDTTTTRKKRWQQATLSQGTAWPQQPIIMTQHDTNKYRMLGLHRRCGSVHRFSLGSDEGWENGQRTIFL
jgi:hypothetical protein